MSYPLKTTQRQSVGSQHSLYPDGVAGALLNIRSERAELGREYRKWLCGAWVRIYAAAIILRVDKSEWVLFCRQPEWRTFRGRPRPKDQTDALRFAVRLAVGFGVDAVTKRAATSRANKYLSRLKPFFEAQMTAREVANILNKKDGVVEARASSSKVVTPVKRSQTDNGDRIQAPSGGWGERLSRLPVDAIVRITARITTSTQGSIELKIERLQHDLVGRA